MTAIATKTKEEIQQIIQSRLTVAGGVMYLCENSLLHKNYFVGELLETILPAIQLGHFRYFENDAGEPVGFVCWAMVDEGGMAKLAKGEGLTDLEEWTAGDQLVFPELIAPFGHIKMIRRDLATNVFEPGTVGLSYRPIMDDEGTFSHMSLKKWRF